MYLKQKHMRKKDESPLKRNWNAFNIAKRSGVSYDKLAKALQLESGIHLSDEESQKLLKEAEQSLVMFSEILNKGKAL